MNSCPFPSIHTPRMLLRPITLEDAADVFEFRSDPEVMKYIPRPIPSHIEEVKTTIKMMQDFAEKGEKLNLSMQLKDTRKVIGTIGFVNFRKEHRRAEVGYSLNSAFHRKGYAKEALQAILSFAFHNLHLHSIEAITDQDNIPSRSLLMSVGFREEALFIEDFLHEGIFRNSIHYGLLQKEFSH